MTRAFSAKTTMRLLLAEDEKDLNRILTKKLTEEGYSVDSCFDGRQALDFLLSAEYDGVILDVMMPELTGWEILKYVRSKPDLNSIGILMLTGIGETLNELSSPMYGADDYIDKPFKSQELIFKIRRVLSRRRKLMAAEASKQD